MPSLECKHIFILFLEYHREYKKVKKNVKHFPTKKNKQKHRKEIGHFKHKIKKEVKKSDFY